MADETPGAIEAGFVRAMRVCKFFPAPAEVIEQIELWRDAQIAAQDAERNEQRQREIREAREAGKLLEFPEVVAMVKRVAESAPLLTKMPKEPKEYQSDMSNAELADRREMLRQQAARLRGGGKV